MSSVNVAETVESGGGTIASYKPSVTWLVGLSGAAVGGAFLNYDKVADAPGLVRFVFFAAATCFGVAVMFGVLYVFWMNSVENKTELKKFLEDEIAGGGLDDKKEEKANGLLGEAKEGIDRAWRGIAFSHRVSIWSFGLGMVFAAILLACALIGGASAKPADGGAQNFYSSSSPSREGYDIVQSAVHYTRHGKEAHTFLLNRASGEVWQMRCQKNSDEVEFRRVHRIDFNGQFEDPKH